MSIISASAIESSLGYQISRSVRLRSSASAYLTRTQSASGNGHLWTYSGWVKRGALAMGRLLCTSASAGSTNSLAEIYFDTSDRLTFFQYTAGTIYTNLVTTQVFRDPSAWYHIVVAYDDAQATSSNRVKMYVNGVQITSFSTASYPSQNFNSFLNTGSQPVWIGPYIGTSNYFDGYLTEINFIDGQALTPSSFGQNNPITGVWEPKQYTGTYGTNGFYLNFSDPSAATAAAIGKDYSGNGNNWTPNNISVTAGVTYDSMIDTPTPYADGGNGRGNYAVLNPLGSMASGTLSNANLQQTRSFAYIQASVPVSTGQWYWEVTLNALGSAGLEIGILGQLLNGSNTIGGSTVGYGYDPKLGRKWIATVNTTGQTTSTVNDVIGFAFDASALTLQVFKNNSSLFTITGITAGEYYATCNGAGTAGTDTVTFNFGQRPFAYTPPTGFKALNTQNLPEPTIKKGNQYFDVVLFSNSSGTTVTGVPFSPDFVWGKNRGGAGNNWLFDQVRGATKQLISNSTAAEATNSDSLQSFTSDGFTLGNRAEVTGGSLVAWNWKANGAGVSNTAGSITSTVSAGVTQGFSVVTYTGTGALATVGHGLGVAPRMILIKSRSQSANWTVYHSSVGNTGALFLNLTNATDTGSAYWNNTSPTSSVFTINLGSASNTSGQTYVAYCFAEVPGFSKFGSYTGNGSADGPFVFCGFRPRWVMFKKSSATSNWSILDTARDTFNVADNPLLPNTSGAETTSTSTSGAFADVLSNGFKLRGNSGDINDSGATYIYAAFSENPFKYALAR